MGTVTYSGTAAAASAATYTYSGTPSATSLDRLRFEVGDIGLPGTAGGTVWMFADAELNFIISEGSDWDDRIAWTCEVLSRQWTRIPSFTADGLSVKKQEVAQAYQDRAKYIRESAAKSSFGEIYLTKIDGYSNDIDVTEVDTTSNVYFDHIRYLHGVSMRFDSVY